MAANFAKIVKEADAAGKAAVASMAPIEPMIVAEHDNPLNDASAVKKAWVVPDGPCGFAWIHFAGNSAFGKWAKKAGIARSDYPKGLCVWVGAYNQSIAKKEVYAAAYAGVLNKHGIDAYSMSRMD